MSRPHKKPRLKLKVTLAFVSLSLIGFVIFRVYHGGYRTTGSASRETPVPAESKWDYMTHATSYLTQNDVQEMDRQRGVESIEVKGSSDFASCQMDTCFNFNRCRDNFKVYVYPIDPAVPMSSTYEKILGLITSSSYHTKDPNQACLFVLSTDTLDRDELSGDFVRNVPTRLQKTEFWNEGENHIVFNLYAGTWPLYNETQLGFNVGKAILAKASMSVDHFRPNFDISLPLFHGTHADKGEEGGLGLSNEFPAYKQHLISFKGKRYVYGIGSETRNSVHHLHNRKDVVMVTTCKHGKNWKEMKDDRCDLDNQEYEKYDYDTLLLNSTFCLVPRGRRLGSFRFLEALRAGCIPVLVSNGWILPFSEVIDWKEATVMGDERTLLQTLEMLRSFQHKDIFALRQATQVIWNQYLASMQKIIFTTFEIMRDRIERHTWREKDIWNSVPGALSFDLDYADDVSRFPFHHEGRMGQDLLPNFTAILYVDAPQKSNAVLFKQVRNACRSKYIGKVLVIWESVRGIPKVWPEVPVPLTIKRSSTKSAAQRFVTRDEVETDAVLWLDEKELISTDEIDFAYSVWRSFPDRIVGYSTRSHFWDESKNAWEYSSKWTNEFSWVVGSGMMYHVYYNHLYWTQTPPEAQEVVDTFPSCQDILINLISLRMTRKPPIKLTWKQISEHSRKRPEENDEGAELFGQRQTCLRELLEVFGRIPQRKSSIRLDPILFRDPVSNLRKKYKQLEVAAIR